MDRKTLAWLAVELLGILFVAAGLSMIYTPLFFITVGLALILGAYSNTNPSE